MIFDEPLERPRPDECDDRLCPMCQTDLLISRHCKLICQRCGYVESCEDNFVPTDVSLDSI